MKRASLILAQCLLAVCFCSGYQGTALPYWENMELYGGQINTLAISSKDSRLVFAGSWSGDGLFKSTDGGVHWESCDYFRNREVFSIDIGGEDQQTIWVAHSMYLTKSVDEGCSWQDSFSSEEEERFCYCVVTHPQDDKTIYLGCGGPERSESGGAIFKTTDGGKNWKKLPFIADYNIRSIVIRQDNPQEVWAVSGWEFVDEGSIYRSDDGGESWIPVTTGLEESWFDEIVLTSDNPPVIFVGGGKGVYRSKDGGINWSQLSISDWPEDSWCRALALDPSDGRTVYAQCYYKFSKSTDSGDHWETYDLALGEARFELLTLVVDPQNPGVMYGGDVNLGVVKSENGGMSWSTSNQGLNASHIFQTVVDPGNPGVIAAGTMVGVYIRQGDSQWEALDYYPSYALAFDLESGLTLYAGFDGWFGKFSLIDKEATFLEFPEQTVTAIAVNPSDPDMLYVGTESYSLDSGGIYQSTDGGDSWDKLLTESAPVNVIKSDPQNHNILYAGSGLFYAPVIMGNLYKSIDGGVSWHMTPLGDMVINTIAIDPGQPEILYVGSGAPGVDCATGIFKSVDGGNTWQWSSGGLPLGSPVVDVELDPDQAQIIYAATFDQGVFISRDSGEYWTLLGMSDYWAYDVASSSSLYKDLKRVRAQSSLANPFYEGTASGLYQYSGAGTGMIIGMITDSSTGKGITGAQVTADTGGVARTVDGAYLLVTAAGSCTLSVSKEGYGSSSRTITVGSADTSTVDLTLTSLTENCSISGTVTDLSTDTPIEGATIVVNPGGYSARSLAGGDFVLGDIVSGSYTLSAFKGGYSTSIESGVAVSEVETTAVNFRLSSLGTGFIGGIITDALSGESIEGAEVRVDPGNFSTATDSEGSYSISDIVTGTYTLYVSHAGHLPYVEGSVKLFGNERVTIDIELQPCPFSVLGSSDRELKKLRRFRDEILLQSQRGKELVSLFYQHAPAATNRIASDPALKIELAELLKMVMPQINDMLNTKSKGLPPQLIRRAEESLKSFCQKDNLKFSSDLHQLIKATDLRGKPQKLPTNKP